MKNKKIIFCGTSRFAAIILESLIEKGFLFDSILTSPDRPVGRKQILTPSPVKQIALEHSLNLLQPQNPNAQEFLESLKNFSPEMIILAAYGKILSQDFLDIPPFGVINIHPSELPKYRGASPLQWALKNGETQTHISIMKMDAKMDHGPLLAQELLEISNEDDFLSLEKKSALKSAEILDEVIPQYFSKTLIPYEQNHAEATFTNIIKKQDGEISSEMSATEIHDLRRAFTPWPGIFMFIKIKGSQKRIKILETQLSDLSSSHPPLQLFKKEENLYLQTHQGTLRIVSLQLEGKNKMTGEEFLKGYSHLVL